MVRFPPTSRGSDFPARAGRCPSSRARSDRGNHVETPERSSTPVRRRRTVTSRSSPSLRTVFGCLALIACVGAYAASVPPVAARNGMVATAQHLATRVGVDVLKRGGNAVDAAVAVGYALGVV